MKLFADLFHINSAFKHTHAKTDSSCLVVLHLVIVILHVLIVLLTYFSTKLPSDTRRHQCCPSDVYRGNACNGLPSGPVSGVKAASSERAG